MAIDIKTFRTRSVTAVIFAAVMLFGLFFNGYSFVMLFIIVMVGCCYEAIKITRKIKAEGRSVYIIPAIIYATIPFILLLDLGFRLTLLPSLFGRQDLAGYSFLLPVAVILSIWINDTMAYIVGSMIGKTPFSKISPKKTWEGTIGGALLCVVLMGAIGYFLPVARGLALKHWLIISAIAAIAGTFGDLFESKLKRLAGIKDSGSFMPGHGGFLDRFDSLLFATPFVWLYVKAFVI